jgi:bacterioferritin (cytochrome b1)
VELFIFKGIQANVPTDLFRMLNSLYASEIVAAQQYYRHANDVKGINSHDLQQIFLGHGAEEEAHAATLRTIIHTHGGTLDNSLASILKNNPSEAKDVQPASSVKTMLEQNLLGEADAIQAYTEACFIVRDLYPDIFVALSEILTDEYDHRNDFMNLLGA